MPAETYDVTNYGAIAGGGDCSPAVRLALREMHGKAGTLVFPKGRYEFWPDQAQDLYVFPSNNDPGLKRVAFPLLNMADVTIDGGGSAFVFHGRIVPFVIQHSRNIHLTNFSIDWDRTFHNEGEVLDAVRNHETGMTRVDLRIPNQFPYRVEYGRLQFLYEGHNDPEANTIGNLLEFDAIKRETAFMVHDNYGVSRSYHAESLDKGVVRMTGAFSHTTPTPGNIMSIGGNGRATPGIVVDASKDIVLTDITIHHCGGMGVIGQSSENIRVERMNVTPSERDGYHRMISTTADATHFVSCRGTVELLDCLFENQLDDATNVHGIYGRIANAPSSTEFLVEWVHSQQLGMDLIAAGDTIEFVNKETLLTYHQATVTASQRVNSQFCRLTLASALPPEVKAGDGVATLAGVADVTIRNCTTRGNRARAFLLSTPGHVVVEDCHLHAPGCAISIAGDASSWFESGGVRDVTIRNNHFDNCNYGVWGGAIIEMNPEIHAEYQTGNDYHRNIKIENNTFDAFDLRLLRARCVDGLTFVNNTIRPSDHYPAPKEPVTVFNVENCSNVEIENSTGID